ncbi:unnamed protein product [Paramecium pentaurelia]|uniref:Uncharacterized protein n=1 Tax=Paramecium pentaurelia TaxID=43138 RepID=A0A8S1VTP0_9CILI|nr:unnamed protein product [Paramecium pentaurelia]
MLDIKFNDQMCKLYIIFTIYTQEHQFPGEKQMLLFLHILFLLCQQ